MANKIGQPQAEPAAKPPQPVAPRRARQAPAGQAAGGQASGGLPPPRPSAEQEAALARSLLRGAREASLATVSEGQPFASLVTPAVDADLSILLWLSRLSGHTRHLARDPRCSLLVLGPRAGPNPQKRARLTLTGLAELVEGEAAEKLKALWLGVHPYAKVYKDFGDFGLWRISCQAAHFVGGFARARTLPFELLRPDPEAVAAVAGAAPEIIAHVNRDHTDALDAIACGLLKKRVAGWRMASVDIDGCVLRRAEARAMPVRFNFPASVKDAGGVREALMAAAKEGRRRLENS
jgi:hypothetical protein